MFKNIFSFDGRIRRTEYWLTSFLIQWVLIPVVFMAGVVTAGIGLLLLAVPFWISLAAAVKRSHDMGNSGWLIIIPIYNPLILAFGGSQPFTNEYGANPKGINQPVGGAPVSQQVVVNNYAGHGEAQKVISNPPPSVLPPAETETLQAVLPETQAPLLTGSATVQSNNPHNDSEKINRLRQLKELLDAGILTSEEFNEQKRKILNN